jgi:hypothetical protein
VTRLVASGHLYYFSNGTRGVDVGNGQFSVESANLNSANARTAAEQPNLPPKEGSRNLG